MDVMTIGDILAVCFPETLVQTMIGLTLCTGNLKKQIRNNTLMFTIKMIITMIFVSTCIYFERKYLYNILAISTISIIVYILNFKLIWNLNYRKSIIAGMVSFFCLMITEFTTFPLYNVVQEFLTNKHFWQNRFILTIPSRLLQILLLFIMNKKKISLKNMYLVSKEWNELSKSNKINCIFLIVSIIVYMFFVFNYTDLFLKINAFDIKDIGINVNLRIYFLQSFLFTVVTIILFNRTRKYEVYKELINKQPTELFMDMLEIATDEELQSYQEMLTRFNDIKNELGGEANEKG